MRAHRRERIAVVGSGIAGLTCAHVLSPHHDVVLFEAAPQLGGHAHTVDVDDPDVGPIAAARPSFSIRVPSRRNTMR